MADVYDGWTYWAGRYETAPDGNVLLLWTGEKAEVAEEGRLVLTAVCGEWDG